MSKDLLSTKARVYTWDPKKDNTEKPRAYLGNKEPFKSNF